MFALLRGVTSKHDRDFYRLIFFHFYTTKNKLEKHDQVCKNHDYCYVEIPNEDNKILKWNHGEKSMKAPFIIHPDLECLLKKISNCRNNPEKSSTTKINEHTLSGYWLFMQCLFDSTKKNLIIIQVKTMKNVSKDLKERATEITNYEKREMIPLTDEENKCYKKQKICYICKKEVNTDKNDINAIKLYHKVRDHCHYTGKYRGAAHIICNLR